MNELIQAISNRNLKTITIDGYKTRYKILVDLLGGRDVRATDPITIIEAIKKYNVPANSRASLLNIAIIIYQYYLIDTDLLIKYRNQLSKLKQIEKVKKNMELEKNGMPSVDELKTDLNSYYDNEEWDKFIILYLLINFNVRNLDLNLIITRAGKDDGINNFLLIKKSYIKYIRNDYKTNLTYGKKVNLIKSAKFIKSVNQFLNNKLSKPLLLQENNVVVSNSNISNYIKNKIGYTEGIVNKSIIFDADKNNTLNKIAEISKNRGTNMTTLHSQYNVNYKL